MQFTSVLSLLAILTPLISATPLLKTRSDTVRVQLNGLDELAIQQEIRIDQSADPFSGSFTDGFIADAEGNDAVTCQAFADAAGSIPVGFRFGADDVIFDDGEPVSVASVRCSVQ